MLALSMQRLSSSAMAVDPCASGCVFAAAILFWYCHSQIGGFHDDDSEGDEEIDDDDDEADDDDHNDDDNDDNDDDNDDDEGDDDADDDAKTTATVPT